MVRGFKAMNIDMTCRGYQFEVGKTYEIDNDKPLRTCDNSGFHFCNKLDNVFRYYPYDECRVFEVQAVGEVVTKHDKSTTKKLRIVRELTKEDLNNYEFSEFCHDLWFKDRTDDELLNYKDHHSFKVRSVVAQKLNNLELMYELFKNDSDYSVRRSVVERMEDLELMFDTFYDDKNKYVRIAVVKRMTDLSLMHKMFKNDPDWFVRDTVRRRMNDRH